ncbi:PAS/PAC sensor signal transduction histidine kinase [Gelidibacter sediminis]|uniref:histidine kinase n=1 Tax=Gelidibacter sediminis TaxID=1608710 RepID=A0A4R7PWZ8_9FLAO|nr:ATP-binding protein [Gelidibacter sediminis]TDU39473.1 PAS/PAC sensor signal transduction histidine kinase [Gelidibacter sediminis]
MFEQDQRKVFKTLLGAVSEGVIIVDENQTIVEINTSAETIFGYTRDELVGQPLNTLIPQRYHASHGGHFNEFMEKQERRQMGKGRDIYGRRKDGSIFPVEAGLNPFEIYDKTYVMSLIIDISDRKKQEQEVLELNNRLEKKVEERTKTLHQIVEELKVVNSELDTENKRRIKAETETQIALQKEIELNELKTKFLSLVSHEFKTPLSGILTSTVLLGKYKLAEQQEKRDKHLNTIINKVHYLNNILNDFLSVERLETGKVNYTFKTFKLSKVLNEVIYNANMLLKDGQKINYPENIDDMSLHQDEKILELSLSNVVHNAIKYSPEHTNIDIKILQDDMQTVFTIKDQGIGIPEIEQKNIFNRYFRAENVLNIQGTGIGLNIVKSHLEHLGGTIEFSSREKEGSTFTITLPNKAH